MTERLDTWLDRAARQREVANRVRLRRALEPLDTVHVKDGGRVLVNFSGNDYLGLAQAPRIRAALIDALDRGVAHGSTGSRLLTGDHPVWAALEGEFAAWQGADAALYFATGTAANVGFRGGRGVGKELAARTLHSMSPWNEKPFVAVDCASLPPASLEQELFGDASGRGRGGVLVLVLRLAHQSVSGRAPARGTGFKIARRRPVLKREPTSAGCGRPRRRPAPRARSRRPS